MGVTQQEKAVTDGHCRHLFASLLAIEEASRQMERVGRDGRSPASGQALTPLAPQDWEAIKARLAQMQERLRQVCQSLASEGLKERDTAEGQSTTLYWLSFLLRQMEEEIVDDLSPSSTEPKFGNLEPEERAALSHLVDNLRADLGAMRAQIERLRREKGGRQ